MFIPDENSKSVKIPARFVDGRLINLLTKQAVSDIAEDSYCDIVLTAGQITNDGLLEALNREKIDEFLPEGTELLANVSVYGGLSSDVISPLNVKPETSGGFVPVILKEPLKIKFRGTKQPTLLDCACFIPALNEMAQSLNHAYTLISTRFENHRRSHSGNVFLKIFYLVKINNSERTVWTNLGNLRTTKIIEFHEYLSQTIDTTKKQEGLFQFDISKYELIKPFLKSILREFNQDISDTEKAIKTLLFVLKEKFKFDQEATLSLKKYIVKLLEEIRDNKETL